MNVIINELKNKKLSLKNEEEWLGRADDIDKKRRTEDQEKFWKEILTYIIYKEKQELKHYHKGHIYLRLAIKKLILGKSYNTVFKYLKLAQKEVKIRYAESGGKPPEDYTSYRFNQVLKCFLRYKNSQKRCKTIIDLYLKDKNQRKLVHKTFCIIYDLSLESTHLKRLGWSQFDKLLGRNRYRVLVESYYKGALWLCQGINEIHRRTNLEQYGLASAIIALCGATIEGILSHNRRLLQAPTIKEKKKKGKNVTLGDYVWAYIDNLNPAPDLTVMLLFLLSIRNQIHPENRNNRFILIDMILGKFIFRLSERIIIKLSAI